MVKVTGPCLSLDAQGALKDSITYQKRPSGHSVYPFSKPGVREPHVYSPAQWTQRAKIKALVAAWQLLSQPFKDLWDALAKEIGFVGTGYHLYIKSGGIYPAVVEALEYDGLDDYVACADSPSLDILGELTLEAWFKNDTLSGSDVIVGKWGTVERAYDAYLSGTRLIFIVSALLNPFSGAYRTSATVFQTGQCYHLGCIFKPSTTLDIYVDGVKDLGALTGAIPASIANTPRKLGIGASEASASVFSGFFDGVIGEVRIWNKTLNPADLLIHAKNYRDLTCANTAGCSKESNLMAHFPMYEGSGITIKDYSGNGNTGSFKGPGEPKWIRQAFI